MFVPLYQDSSAAPGSVCKILAALCHLGQNGETDVDAITRLTRQSTRKVRDVLGWLHDRGWVRVDYRVGWVCYEVLRPKGTRMIQVPQGGCEAIARLSPGAAAAFFALRTFTHHQDGLCFPSVRTLAQKIGKSVRTVQVAVRSLQIAGLFHVTREKAKDVARFLWPTWKRRRGVKRVTLYHAIREGAINPRNLLSSALKTARIAGGLLREVMALNLKTQNRLSGKKMAIVDLDEVPASVRAAVEACNQPGCSGPAEPDMERAVKWVGGATEPEARYLSRVCGAAKLVDVVGRLAYGTFNRRDRLFRALR